MAHPEHLGTNDDESDDNKSDTGVRPLGWCSDWRWQDLIQSCSILGRRTTGRREVAKTPAMTQAKRRNHRHDGRLKSPSTTKTCTRTDTTTVYPLRRRSNFPRILAFGLLRPIARRHSMELCTVASWCGSESDTLSLNIFFSPESIDFGTLNPNPIFFDLQWEGQLAHRRSLAGEPKVTTCSKYADRLISQRKRLLTDYLASIHAIRLRG